MDLVLDDISNHIWWLDPNLLRSDPRSDSTKKIQTSQTLLENKYSLVNS